MTDDAAIKKRRGVHVSGNIQIDAAYFAKYYEPALKLLVSDDNVDFYVGGARGADEMTQRFLLAQNVAPSRVFVFDCQAEDHRVSPDFTLRNGFVSYVVRDAALTAATTEDLVVVHQYGGGGSGSFANVLRRKYGDAMARELQQLLRDHSSEYDKTAIKRECNRAKD
jgi:hypothetical protein